MEHEPIRVAQVIGKMWAGGVEAVVFNYYRAIDKTKIQFDFFYDADSTVEPPTDLVSMGAHFYKIPPYQKIFSYIFTLEKILKRNHYTIIHSHLNTLSSIPLYVAWKVDIPIRIAHNHSVPGGTEWKRNILKKMLKRLVKIFPTDYFACSEKAGRWLFGDKLYNSGKVYLMHNAIEISKFKFNLKNREEIRDKWNIQNKLVIGHVGRFTFAKNHKFLLQIFSEIHKKNPDSILLLVGDGELHNQIEKIIEALALKPYIVLIGKTNVPENYYSAMDVMVMPSIFEGLSLTTIEAQANGIPVLVSEAIPDEAIISNGVSRCSLEDNADIWANQCLAIAKKKITLSEKANNYLIDSQANKLCYWYLESYYRIKN